MMMLAKPQWTISLPTELHPFIILVLENPDLQERLASAAEANAFVAEAIAVATELGVALDQAILADVLRPDPLGLGRFNAAPILCTVWPPTGWLPARSVPTSGVPAFDWLWFGAHALRRPFFEDDVRIAGALPFNWLFRIRTSLDALIAGAGGEPEMPLHGLIYHMSRCGSTLLAQIYAAVPENAVSSEPEPLDGIIQWARMAQVEPEKAMAAIRAMVAALGRDRGTGAARHIIKLDARHAFSLPMIRAAYPEVNWIYLYRDAVEVMVSHMQQPGALTTPGVLPESGLHFGIDGTVSLEDFAARVLARIGESIIAHQHLGGGMLVSYTDIVDSATGAIAAHFNLSLDAAALAIMKATSGRDAKDPQSGFSSDIFRKRAAATAAIEAAVARWLQPVEQELVRLSKAPKHTPNTPQK